MSQITAQLVRDLREKTGAGMMDCKKALSATDGDFEAAVDHLRKQGLKTADKKAGRTTGEGRVFSKISADGASGSMVAVSCETDFVARTPDFDAYLEALSAHVLEHGSDNVETLLGQPWAAGGTVEDGLKTLIGKLGENIQIADVQCCKVEGGRIVAYVHHDQKKGALVGLATGAEAAQVDEVGKSLCMHIVVYSPAGLDRDAIDAETIERERAIFREEVKGKPEEIQDKIINGKLEKFYAERVLTEQPWVLDDKMSVQKALEKALGSGTKIAAMKRFEVGS